MKKLISLIFFCVLALTLRAQTSQAADHYVRAGAAGNGSGADWANACTDFSGSCSVGSLVRGDTYYVAGGSYGPQTWNTPSSGSLKISILGATVAAHGTSTGWSDTFAVGAGNQAVWGFNQVFTTPNWIFDGVAGDPMDGSAGASLGFTFAQSSCSGGQHYIDFGNGNNSQSVDGSKFSHLLIRGCGGDVYRAALYTNYPTSNNNVTASWSYYDNLGSAMRPAHASGWLIEHNYMINHFSSPANHGEWINIFGANNLTYRYNYMHDSQGTGGFISNDAGSCDTGLDGAMIYGNVFLNNGGGNGMIGATTRCWIKNTVVYNNTFAFNHQNSGWWFAGCMPGAATCSNATGNVAENNLIFSMKAGVGSNVQTDDYNSFFNTTSTPSEPHGQVSNSDPFLNSVAGDFHLGASTAAGVALASPFDLDPDGALRGASGTWDRGAFQFGSVISSRPKPPTALQVVSVQ